MKKLILALFLFSSFFTYSQTNSSTKVDSLEGFSMKEMLEHLKNFHGTEQEKQLRIQRSKRAFIDRKYKLGVYAPPVISQKGTAPSTQAFNCTNIDFESGNTSGWTVTGDNALVSSGTDAFGGFNKVYAGSYSLMLSSNNTATSNFQSIATRTLTVPSVGQTFFRLHFALDILDYPHTQSDAAKFYVNFFDASGNQLPCPQYECYYYQNSAGAGVAVGISSFQQTWGNPTYGSNTGPGVNLGGEAFPVTYCDWQTVAMDLSSYAGQNITCKIECDWCVYNYDWAYCYIDADCPSSTTPTLPTCGALPLNLCGPSGMDTYSWTAPPGNSPPTSNTSCINAAVAGTYTLNASLNTCNTTAYTFTYNVQPGPTPSFTDNPTPCSGNVSFGSTSSTNGGPAITSYTWNWGDGSANGSGMNATHTYTNTGTNNVTLLISNGTCIDSIVSTVNIPDHPVAIFATNNVCLGTAVSYTSSSTATAGIANQIWHFGDNTNGAGSPVSHSFVTSGTYNSTLVVTDNNGCKDSVTHAVTVYPPPTITVNSSTICLGQQTATLTANGASTYTWSPAATLSGSNGASVTGNPASTTVYTITGTDANTCSNTATATITVNPIPTITINSSTICLGQQTATLTANGASTYTWSPSATLNGSTGTSVNGNPASTTVYTINGTDANTCTNTATTTITVNSTPVVTVNSSTICAGQQTATLTANGASTYTWSPSGTLSGSNGTTVTGSPGSTTIYTVSGADVNTCTSTATTTITVNPLPIVTVNSATICLGQQTATLTANGASTYTWSPSATLSGSIGNSVTGTPVATTIYTVSGTDVNTCTNTATSTITVNPLPIISVNSSTICIGQQTATLTANGASTYTWSPSATLSGNTGTSVTGNPITTTNYTLMGTDFNGCISTNTANIVVNPLPVPIASSNSPICANQLLTFTCTPAGLISYVWTGPDVLIGATTSTPSLTAAGTNSAGVYTVVVTDNNSCVNSTTVSVIVNPLPVITASAAPVCEHQTINLVATGGVSYEWSGPGSPAFSSVLQNPTISNADPTLNAGSYVVLATDANGCQSGNVANVIVYPLPIISVNTATICLGQQTATLTANGATSYMWNPSTGLSTTISPEVYGVPSSTTDYTVTGTDANGCVNTATTNIYVNQLPIVATSSIMPGCAPLCPTMTVTSSPPADTYSCSFGNGQSFSQTNLNPPLSSFQTSSCFNKAGTFEVKVTVTDINSCVSTATTMAVVYPIPKADFEYQPNPVTILAPEVSFFNQSIGQITNYSWGMGDGDTSSLLNPAHTYADTGTYYVTLVVISVQGCTDTTIKPLVVKNEYALYVPNAFSPNGDGKNDVFAAVGEGMKDFKLYIFDRWGNSLFYSDNINRGWNGTMQNKGGELLQQDVYVWKIDAIDYNNKSKSMHGTVTLLR